MINFISVPSDKSAAKDAPATVQSVEPTSICGNGGFLFLYGQDFQKNTKVNLTSDATGATCSVTVIFLNSTVVQLELAEGSVPTGMHD